MSGTPVHQWTYQVESIIGTVSEAGPIAESELLQIARAGKIKSETLVMSLTRTKGAWMKAQQIAGLLQVIQAGSQERQAAKEQAAKEKAAAQQAAATQRNSERQAAADQQATARANLAREIAQVSHCSNIDTVKTILDRVQGILTSQEVVEYIAVQQKPLVNLAPDALIATNRRLIFYRPKLLGRFDFGDYQWIDLCNAHMQSNLMGSVFSATHINGQRMSMDYLPKESAQALYRIAQEREEAAKLQRRQLELDHAKAGAMQVNVGIPQMTAAPTVSPAAPPAGNDLVQRMQTLKLMLDQGLIEQSDFDARKKEILASV